MSCVKFAASKINRKYILKICLPVHPRNGCPVYPSLQVQMYPAPFGVSWHTEFAPHGFEEHGFGPPTISRRKIIQ